MAMWPNPRHYTAHDDARIPEPEADTTMPDFPEDDWQPDCPACGAEMAAAFLGRLGHLAWWRCRQCGWEQAT